ncbi:MAG: glycosyltransferase family 4 protein, partial [Acetobacteraceae bacterium]|nr:glycosyltransferase family 4 protein [Acetobacteraceae bacterium]
AADETVVVDGLGLPACDPARLRDAGAVALIHHPTSLEAGLDSGARDALTALEAERFAACARLVATSPLTARGLPALGAPEERVGVVEPGTDPAPRATGSGEAGARILAVGALIPRKGHDVLLRALAGLTDLEWSLRIAGPAPDPVHAHGLQALAEELGIAGRVAFLGRIGDAQLEGEYAAADIFALATWHEGYGMAAAEAMARGLPLAITAGGAVAEVVARPAAVISPPGDHRSLAKGLRRMILDEELRAQMADAAWDAAQKLPRWSDRAALFARELEAAHG